MKQSERLAAKKSHLYAIAETLEERQPGSKESADAIRAAADELFVSRAILRKIGFPQRGTEDEALDIYAAAGAVQHHFTAEQLSIDD